VLRLVVIDGLRLTLLGLGFGLAGALAATRLLSSLLYGVKPHDPSTLISVAILLAAVALFASYVPARRATTVDPMAALRHE
jgi:putative ABC transport system permease protein